MPILRSWPAASRWSRKINGPPGPCYPSRPRGRSPRAKRSHRCPIRTGLSLLLILIVGAVIWWKPREEQPRPLDELDRLITIARAGPQKPGSLANIWKARLRKDDATTEFHQPAAFQAYQVPEVPESECDSLPYASEGRNNACYCPADEKISWDSDFIDLLYQLLGSIAPLAILLRRAGDHCEAGARTLYHARSFGWLDRLLHPGP